MITIRAINILKLQSQAAVNEVVLLSNVIPGRFRYVLGRRRASRRCFAS